MSTDTWLSWPCLHCLKMAASAPAITSTFQEGNRIDKEKGSVSACGKIAKFSRNHKHFCLNNKNCVTKPSITSRKLFLASHCCPEQNLGSVNKGKRNSRYRVAASSMYLSTSAGFHHSLVVNTVQLFKILLTSEIPEFITWKFRQEVFESSLQLHKDYIFLSIHLYILEVMLSKLSRYLLINYVAKCLT